MDFRSIEFTAKAEALLLEALHSRQRMLHRHELVLLLHQNGGPSSLFNVQEKQQQPLQILSEEEKTPKEKEETAAENKKEDREKTISYDVLVKTTKPDDLTSQLPCRKKREVPPEEVGGPIEMDIEDWIDMLLVSQLIVLINQREKLLNKNPNFNLFLVSNNSDSENEVSSNQKKQSTSSTSSVSSVDETLCWRKNIKIDQERQCWPGRYGWFSDRTSIHALLSSYQTTGLANAFLDQMGFDEPYNDMFFLFFTTRQLKKLKCTKADDDKNKIISPVDFFVPTWTEMLRIAKQYIEGEFLKKNEKEKSPHPVLGTFTQAEWLSALDYYQHVVLQRRTLGEMLCPSGEFNTSGPVASKSEETKNSEKEENMNPSRTCSCGRRDDEDNRKEIFHEVLQYAATHKWNNKEKDIPPHPIMEPFHAVRYLMDVQFGANELFSGDGWTYSRKLVKGQREYLCSSFKNLRLPRVRVTEAVSP